MAPVTMPLNDLEGHSLLLIGTILTHIPRET